MARPAWPLRLRLCMLATAFAVASCASDDVANDGPLLGDLDGSWTLVGGIVQPVDDGLIRVTFDDATVSGEVYCNNLSGDAMATTSEFRLSDVAVETDQCGPLLDISSGAFVQTLLASDRARIEGEGAARQLTLDGELGDLVFLFEG